MFNSGSQLTITESVVKSADFWVESADFPADSTGNPVKICQWVWAFKGALNGDILFTAYCNAHLGFAIPEIDSG